MVVCDSPALPSGGVNMRWPGTGRASSDARSGSKATASRPSVAFVLAVGDRTLRIGSRAVHDAIPPAEHDRIRAAQLTLAT
jgi:hypothetical protein